MRRGFTLIEVMVALLIMAVIAVMGWQGVSAMARAREISAEASERTLRLAAVVSQWEQDLQAVVDDAQLPGIAFDGASLRLLRRAATGDDDSGSGVQVVAWRVHEGRWLRWASPPLQRRAALNQAWAAAGLLQGSGSGQLVLAEGVAEWQVYFWRGQGWSNAQSSGDLVAAAPPPPPASGASAPQSAPAAATRVQLPAAVRLQIALPAGRLTRDVMLAPSAS